jgi:hypothetical protein
MIDDVVIDFDWIQPALSYDTDTANTLTLTFNNVESLPAKNYNVKLYISFNDSAIKKAANTTTKQGQNDYAIWTVKIGSNGTESSSLGVVYHVAKAYPIIAVKEKNTNSGNERLDLNVSSNTSEYKVELNTITATGSGGAVTFKKASGSAWDFVDVILWTTAEVARSTTAKTAVQSVTFTVTDDEWYQAQYSAIDAATIADFASLSL